MCIRDRSHTSCARPRQWKQWMQMPFSPKRQRLPPDVYKRQVFDIGQNVVSGAAGVIHGNTSIDIDSTIAQMRTGMESMGVGELLGPVSYTHLDVYKRQDMDFTG